MFFLNDAVAEDDKASEFICYRNGHILYNHAVFPWPRFKVEEFATPRVTHTAYKKYQKLLSSTEYRWQRVDISEAALSVTSEDTIAVYTFFVPINLLDESLAHTLYVGKTTIYANDWPRT